eukprot:COSAG06_NODE_4034_length_4639_cov_77.635711_5_plen_70_part_00
MISDAYAVCEKFSVSIGFHSGSGKSAENYEACGECTGGHLEVKTSGRYTYLLRVMFEKKTAETLAIRVS